MSLEQKPKWTQEDIDVKNSVEAEARTVAAMEKRVRPTNSLYFGAAIRAVFNENEVLPMCLGIMRRVCDTCNATKLKAFPATVAAEVFCFEQYNEPKLVCRSSFECASYDTLSSLSHHRVPLSAPLLVMGLLCFAD